MFKGKFQRDKAEATCGRTATSQHEPQRHEGTKADVALRKVADISALCRTR